MDPLSLTAGTLAIFPLLLENIKNPGLLGDFINYHILDVWSKTDTPEERRKKILDKLRTTLLQSLFPGVWHQWMLIKNTVLPGDDHTAEQFRLAYVSDCNMTAVAGAIIAQVAITGLSLPQISQTHWVVRAFFITSLISGCFAVYFACWSQKTIGALFKASDLKDWLTRRESVPLSGWRIRRRLKQLATLKKLGDKTKTGLSAEYVGDLEKGLLDDFNNLQEWQRSASLWSAFLLQVPFTYMKLSLGSFVIGLSVYLGFVWTRNLDQDAGKTDSRNIFIVLLVVVVACIYFYVAPALYKSLEVLPVQSWKAYQDQLKDFAGSQARFLQHPFPDDLPATKRDNPLGITTASGAAATSSGTNDNNSSSSVDDSSNNNNRKSSLRELPFALSPSATVAVPHHLAQLTTTLRDAISAQMSTNISIRTLVTEIENLTAAMRQRERGR